MITKFLIILVITFCFVSCKQKNETNIRPSIPSSIDSTKTRYTFSQFNDIDLTVSVGSYQILYDYSSPIDTFFVYSGAFIFGQDSVLYLQVRKDKSDETKESNDKMYDGSVTNLILYNGKKFKSIHPPYYSAFTVKNKILYYWGYKNFEQLFACKYDLITHEFQKIKLSNETDGTDYFGHYDPPYFNEKGNIEFSIAGGQRMWVIDSDFKKILTFKEDPSELYFESDEKGDTL
jgi:hypothetical protein